MTHTLIDEIGHTPANSDPAPQRQPGRPRAGQTGVHEPRRIDQGPRRPLHDRGRGAQRGADAGQNRHRGHQRQYRDRTGAGLCRQRLSAAAGHVRIGQRGAPEDPAGPRGGYPVDTRAPQHRRCHRGSLPPGARKPREVFHDGPVQQSGQLYGPQGRHCHRNLAAEPKGR